MRLTTLILKRYLDYRWMVASVSIASILFLGTTFAFDSDLLSLNLRGANLSGAQMNNRDLRYADFQGANLSRTNLFGADLRKANLTNTNLSRADLRQANLSDATLKETNLLGANSTGALGLTKEQILLAKLDRTTLLPDYLPMQTPTPTPDNGEAIQNKTEYEFNAFRTIKLSYVPYTVALTPDGMMLFSVGRQTRDVHRWRMTDDAQPVELPAMTGHSADGRSVAVRPDGQVIASGSDDGRIRLWRIDETTPFKTLNETTSEGYVFSLKYSQDGQRLASASRSATNEAKTIHIWDAESVRAVSSINIARTEIIVDIDPNQQITVVMTPPIQGAQLRSIDDNSLIGFLKESSQQTITGGTFSDDGRIVALSIKPTGNKSDASGTVSRTGAILLWDTDEGQVTGTPLIIPRGSVTSIAFSPDRQLIAAGWTDGSVRLWRVDDGVQLPNLVGHYRDVRSIAFSADGQTLASAGADRTIRLWRVIKK